MTILMENRRAFVLNHVVDLYIKDSDIRSLISSINNSETSSEDDLVFSNMGVQKSDKEFIRRADIVGDLDMEQFKLPSRREYGYHAKV